MLVLIIVFIILIIPLVKYILYYKETTPKPANTFNDIIYSDIDSCEILNTKDDDDDNDEIISKCIELSHSHADIGTVTPIEVYAKNFCIIPYQSAKIETQQELADKLSSLNKDISRDYILENWQGSNVMYVMVSGNEFIGSVAVDRKNFEPFISHLYIDKTHRNKGYGKRLLEHGILYSREFKFNTVKLWCDEEMIPYYEKLGWTNEKRIPSGLYIMQKCL